MSVTTDSLIASSLLPGVVLERVHTRDEEARLGEAPMCALSLLIVNTALKAIEAIETRNFKAFDANPGDGGCQTRALELRRLFALDLKAECDALKDRALKIKELVNRRKSSPKERDKSAPDAFFNAQFKDLFVSKEMEYLLHCFLSKTLRTPYETRADGVVMTKSEISKLAVLAKGIDTMEYLFRRKIVENNQKILSILSVEVLFRETARISSLKEEEKALLCSMFSSENTRLFTPHEAFEPKLFASMFHQVKTVLFRLREERALICLKTIVPKGKIAEIAFFQPKEAGDDFVPVSDCTLSKDTPVVVLDAVVLIALEEAIKSLMKEGFTDTILSLSAEEPPFEPTTSVEDIKEPKAREEITAYKGKRERFMILDHIFLDTLGALICKKE